MLVITNKTTMYRKGLISDYQPGNNSACVVGSETIELCPKKMRLHIEKTYLS